MRRGGELTTQGTSRHVRPHDLNGNICEKIPMHTKPSNFESKSHQLFTRKAAIHPCCPGSSAACRNPCHDVSATPTAPSISRLSHRGLGVRAFRGRSGFIHGFCRDAAPQMTWVSDGDPNHFEYTDPCCSAWLHEYIHRFTWVGRARVQ